MKFLYVDESGNNADDPYLIFFGLQIDAYRLKSAIRAIRPIINDIEHAFRENLREVKSSRMLNAVGGWRNVDSNLRKELFRRLCNFVQLISATCFAYAIDRNIYNAQNQNTTPTWASTPWITGAITISMFVQRENQNNDGNKGLTVLIFDDNKQELHNLSTFLINSSEHVDEYYERKRRSEPFDHVIDTAFAIKSEHSLFVQVADACAYTIRRRAEIELCNMDEMWQGECQYLLDVFNGFKDRICFPTKTWSGQPRCHAVEWIRRVSIPNFKAWIIN